ncbi:hypothetical protein LZ30DRAFT_683159 [Colletotrichum cereale]|nr:hypothetical protein LZ30DRAFT_683159 [Colletotrichum cereale]
MPNLILFFSMRCPPVCLVLSAVRKVLALSHASPPSFLSSSLLFLIVCRTPDTPCASSGVPWWGSVGGAGEFGQGGRGSQTEKPVVAVEEVLPRSWDCLTIQRRADVSAGTRLEDLPGFQWTIPLLYTTLPHPLGD